MKLALLLVLLQSFHVTYGQSGGCEKLKNNKCSSCLELPGCIWCSDVNYTSIRCSTREEHARFQCNTTVDGNPSKPKLEPGTLDDLNQITPRRVSSRVRVGESFDFTVEIQPSQNYPVDFYFLMDLTKTMSDDLDNVKKLAQNISDKLNELTTRNRLAFGSFVDKVVDPYSRREAIGKPFEGKDIPYDYKHSLNFTDNAQEFKDKINAQDSSGNRDVAEGTFDALMQIAACEKELDWGPKNSTRRMVLIATDGTFHMAGEGRFGGIVNPNDAKCHLGQPDKGVRLYDKSLELDYPSVNQVYQRLVESRIQPIFAVTSEKASAYQPIVNKWESSISATLGKLDGDSSNIIDLIQESYDKITSKVQLEAANKDDSIEVRIKNVQCPSSSSDNVCTGANPGTKVSFEVTVTAKSCDYGNKSSFQLSSAAFGTVQIDLDIICSCDCESVAIPKSPRCNGNGSLVCGSCDCDEGWSGEYCQCDSERFSDINVDKCKSKNQSDGLTCSGNGECVCGVCQCNIIPGETEEYYGQYCQCNNFNCELSNNLVCGGTNQGVCNCGTCECKEEYTGSNCGDLNCALFLPNCLTDGEGGAKVNCSGHGSCDCGNCRCDSFYEGLHCERCPSCVSRCGDYQTCVLCEVFGVTPANKTLCENCPTINKLKSLSALQALQLPTTCQETDDEGCTYYYSYEEKNNITKVYAVESKDCPEGPDVLLIVLAVIGGIVGIGIILLILWKLLTAMVDRREYQKFEQDRAKSKWHREKNPLYQPATSTVQNPTFVGSKS